MGILAFIVPGVTVLHPEPFQDAAEVDLLSDSLVRFNAD